MASTSNSIPLGHLITQLEFFAAMGVTHLHIPETPSEAPLEQSKEAQAEQPALHSSSQGEPEQPPAPSLFPDSPSADAAPSSFPPPRPEAKEEEEPSPAAMAASELPEERIELEEVRNILGDCRRCPLHQARTQIVFGVGDVNADLMFVGEAPGEDEDALGLPFVGRAGALLSKIILAMGLSRDRVYVANILKCRPPRNRDPEAQEVLHCSPFLRKQIEAVRPLVLVALGRYASLELLQTTTPITRLRGNWGEFHGVPLMPTFHPSYLLRNPSAKRDVWEDMKAVRDKLKELGSRYYPPES